MTKRFFNCTCRFCGADFQSHNSYAKTCKNPECQKKAKHERDKRYRESEKGRETKRRDYHSERYKANRKRYEHTEEFIKAKHERNKRYRQDPKQREMDKIRKLRYYYRKQSAIYNNTVEGADAITQEQFRSFYYADTCYYCGKKFKGQRKTIDHKIPVSRGGTNAVENLCVCCLACNSKKHDKTEAEYLAEVV